MPGNSSVTGDQSIFSTDNICFDGSRRDSPMSTNGQLWIGSTASDRPNNGGHVRLGSLTSPGGTVTIGYIAPNITLEAGGVVPTQFTGNTGTAVPVAGNINILGATVAAGTSPLVTAASGSTVTINAQTSQALAAADATKIGLSNFDSAIFTVTATGFVSTSGGTLVQSITGGPGVTITGTASVPIINSVVFTDTTAATLAVDNGYFATAAGTYPMPATAAQGEMVIVVADTAGAVVLDCPASNFIRVGSSITSSGGTATSNAIGDSLTLRYRASSLTWEATSAIGTWTLA